MTAILVLVGVWILTYAMAYRMDRYKARRNVPANSRYFSGGWPSGGATGDDRDPRR